VCDGWIKPAIRTRPEKSSWLSQQPAQLLGFEIDPAEYEQGRLVHQGIQESGARQARGVRLPPPAPTTQ
jgi:hypothetical protein